MVGRRHTPTVLVVVALLWVFSPARAAEPADMPPPQQAFLLWQQGYLHHLYGNYDKAIEMFRQSIAVYPTAEGHTYLGWSLSKQDKLGEAIAECRNAIALDPDYGNPYNDIGVYLIELGRPDEAIPWLEKAMQAKRYCCYQFAHFNLGRILLLKGDLEEAKRAFERALSYDPGYVPALRGLDYIEQQGETL